MIKKIIAFTLIIIAFPLSAMEKCWISYTKQKPIEAMQHIQPMITLVSQQEGKVPFVISIPKDAALESEYFRILLSGISPEQAEQKISFTLISPDTLENINDFLISFHKYKAFKGKKLLDTLQKAMPRLSSNPQRLISFLKAAELLDLKPATDLAARMIAQLPNARTIIVELLRSTEISERVKERLNAYHYLFESQYRALEKESPEEKRDYEYIANFPINLSVQDYLDYDPETMADRIYGARIADRPEVFLDIFTGRKCREIILHLDRMNFTSLEGLSLIPCKDKFEELYITGNRPLEIPNNSFAQFVNLRKLRLGGEYLEWPNVIEQIPEDIFTLNQLRELLLSNNRISYINSSGLAKLPNLEVLDLNNNQITEIPKDIGTLQSLTKLYLRNNRISYINPNDLAQLPNLRVLDLSRNPLTEENKDAIRNVLEPRGIILFKDKL